MIKFCPNCTSDKLVKTINDGKSQKKLAQHCFRCSDCEGRFLILITTEPQEKDFIKI